MSAIAGTRSLGRLERCVVEGKRHSDGVEQADAEDWISAHVEPVGPIQTFHERPWAIVLRVPLADGTAWFKACGSVQGFEPWLTAQLCARWPDRVPEMIAWDQNRKWLLLADAGPQIAALGNPPELWLAQLPRYAELQQGEVAYADDHLQHGVPDLRVESLASRYEDLLRKDLPLDGSRIAHLRRFANRFEDLCVELADAGIPDTIQHDDLHMNNVFVRAGELRILDWGDSCLSHPFASLVATFRFLEERNGLASDDPWFARLRDAYIEPWGAGLTEIFDLATKVGAFAYAMASLRQRGALSAADRAVFDEDFTVRLRRAVAQAVT
jgi:hypothetical protein